MFKPIPTYLDERGNVVQFFPIPKDRPIPGFSHRCAINGHAVKAWFVQDRRPSKDDAEYFFEKYGKELAK